MIRESEEFIPDVIAQINMVCTVSFACFSAYLLLHFLPLIQSVTLKCTGVSSFQLFNQALFWTAAK